MQQPGPSQRPSAAISEILVGGTQRKCKEQEAWRPVSVYHCIQDRWVHPDLVIDVTDFWKKKMEVLVCFKSQFFNPNSTQPESAISVPTFLPTLEGRAHDMGRLIGVPYGEGFTVERPPGVGDLMALG